MHTVDCIFCVLSSGIYTECFAFSATERHVWCFDECVAVVVSSTVEAWMAAWRCFAVASFHMYKNVEWKLEWSVLLLLIKGLTVLSVDVPDKWFSFDNTGFTQSHQQNFSIFSPFNHFWPSILCVQAGSWCCFYFSALLLFPHLSVRRLVLCAAMESQHDNTRMYVTF